MLLLSSLLRINAEVTDINASRTVLRKSPSVLNFEKNKILL